MWCCTDNHIILDISSKPVENMYYPGEIIRAGSGGKTPENGSSNTVIISGGEILVIMFGFDWNPENPATRYDHHITASTFLPFSGGFLPEIHRIIVLDNLINIIIQGNSNGNF